ncbi:MAG: tannase/feruloyl esterase family alpha/beta hydrolase [Deltaproteobacteria bacterium]|nr:tannase/feruloyl esterase family alpha/beta hydrolase [Deltaproteobacteria bacterium]
MQKRKVERELFMYLFGIIILSALLFSACEKEHPKSELLPDVTTDLTVDYTKADILPAKPCDSMSSFKADDIIQLGAAEIPAQGSTPGFCKVRGMLDPEIAFEVNLPEKWNGRFYMIGNGGHAGQALDDPMQVPQVKEAVEKGFAIALTNTGHDAQKEPGASFVMSNPQKAVDYAYRAVHLTAVTAKAITADYYETPVKYSYWNSCSNGGRQGLIEAQRFPEDFDGIIANAPWVDQTGFSIGAIWNQKALSGVTITAEKMAVVAERVMAKCDQIDGLKDGLIDDPRKCDFDPVRDVPVCEEGKERADCLTMAQLEAIAKVYQGPVSNGENIFPGFMPGSEAVMPGLFGGPSQSGWMGLIISAQPGFPSADFGLAQDTMRYLVHNPPKPDYDPMTFDFDKDIHMLDAWSRIADAKNPDLSDFKKHGGKLLMTYGWSDPVLQPLMGVNYYEKALEVNGPDTRDFFRLFMIPGMSHCSGGECPDQYDPISAISTGVKRGWRLKR